ncbi:MAG: sulfotransferase family protein [Dehalococcoidia bacterium]|nr:sulfotransferase family protein [Dehalococcoidia bacterium]
MTLEVVGAGFGRTGTLSLKLALQQLGFSRCYHMFEVGTHHPEHRPIWSAAHRGEAVDWDALFEGYRAAVDWPACNLWEELSAYYPQSKVILTVRDPEAWHRSVMKTIYASSADRRASDDPEQAAQAQWAFEVIWDHVFDGRIEDRDHAITIFEAHVQRVIQTVPPERLLVFDAAQGWGPLCDFLGVPTPGAPYPRTNTSEEWAARAGGE